MTDEEIAAAARTAGLDRALHAFPAEVLAATHVALDERDALGRLDDPAGEPWTTMPR